MIVLKIVLEEPPEFRLSFNIYLDIGYDISNISPFEFVIGINIYILSSLEYSS